MNKTSPPNQPDATTCAIDDGPAQSVRNASDAPAPSQHAGKRVLVFVDPMCSWCWGFKPELDQLTAAAAGRAEIEIIVGGLRTDAEMVMDDAMRDYIRHHWQDVAERTGQPFDFAFFDRRDFIYNTEPACRAVVAVRSLNPPSTLAFYRDVQQSFYAENRDVTDERVLADLAAAHGITQADFRTAFSSAAIRAATMDDFKKTRTYGISGFPSVVCAEADQFAILTLGWRPFGDMAPLFNEWLTT